MTWTMRNLCKASLMLCAAAMAATSATAATLQAKAVLQADKPGPQISRNG